MNNLLIQSLTDDQLIEVAEACNSEYPGTNELTEKLSTELFPMQKKNTIGYIGLGCLVAGELAKRFKNKNNAFNCLGPDNKTTFDDIDFDERERY
jgi:hypothetical protein